MAVLRRMAIDAAALRAHDHNAESEALVTSAAIAAIAKLIEAAGDGTPEECDRAVSKGLWFGPHRAERLRTALAAVTPAAPTAPLTREQEAREANLRG